MGGAAWSSTALRENVDHMRGCSVFHLRARRENYRTLAIIITLPKQQPNHQRMRVVVEFLFVALDIYIFYQ